MYGVNFYVGILKALSFKMASSIFYSKIELFQSGKNKVPNRIVKYEGYRELS